MKPYCILSCYLLRVAVPYNVTNRKLAIIALSRECVGLPDVALRDVNFKLSYLKKKNNFKTIHKFIHKTVHVICEFNTFLL